jgi:hypothetical protein
VLAELAVLAKNGKINPQINIAETITLTVMFLKVTGKELCICWLYYITFET